MDMRKGFLPFKVVVLLVAGLFGAQLLDKP